MNTLIVIPTYNESLNINTLLQQLSLYAPNAHVLFVDDNSPDRTADITSHLLLNNPEYSHHQVFIRSGPRGLGRAYRDGFRIALDSGYDTVVQMDADLSHDPKYLPTLIQKCQATDLVIGSRYCSGGGVRDWPRSRLMLSRFACWYVQRVADIPIQDATAGFRCWTRRALQSIDISSIKSEGYSFQVEMTSRAIRAGMRIVETPIIFTDRTHGKSKISRSVILESLLMPWKLRFDHWVPPVLTERTPAAN